MAQLQPLKAGILARVSPPPPGRHGGVEGPSVIMNGRLAVSVRLHGKHGAGRWFFIDEADWHRVKLTLGARWLLGRAGDFEYVAAYGGRAGLVAGKGRGLVLARWLTNAAPGQVVLYRNGDALDLTRGNLIAVSRREHLEAMTAMALARKAAGDHAD